MPAVLSLVSINSLANVCKRVRKIAWKLNSIYSIIIFVLTPMRKTINHKHALYVQVSETGVEWSLCVCVYGHLWFSKFFVVNIYWKWILPIPNKLNQQRSRGHLTSSLVKGFVSLPYDSPGLIVTIWWTGSVSRTYFQSEFACPLVSAWNELRMISILSNYKAGERKCLSG